MPTAARLVAALAMAVLALAVSEMVKRQIPEIVYWGWFSWVNTVLGAIIGWSTIGARAGRGNAAAAGHGLTAAFALVFWAVLSEASYTMVENALHRRYRGPFEALVDIVRIGVEDLGRVQSPAIWGGLALGAVAAALLAEAASRRWT